MLIHIIRHRRGFYHFIIDWRSAGRRFFEVGHNHTPKASFTILAGINRPNGESHRRGVSWFCARDVHGIFYEVSKIGLVVR